MAYLEQRTPRLEGFDLPIVIPPIELTDEDFQLGQLYHQTEGTIEVQTPAELFPVAVLALLSPNQDYGMNRRIYQNLLNQGLNHPSRILANPIWVYAELRSALYNNDKYQRLLKMAAWWQGSPLPTQILADRDHGHTQEAALRNQLAAEAAGIGLKSASWIFNLLGFNQVIPVDTHMCSYLYSHGVNLRLPDGERVSGPMGREYLRLEATGQQMAREIFAISPADLQRAVWVKGAGWKPQNSEVEQPSSNQMVLPF